MYCVLSLPDADILAISCVDASNINEKQMDCLLNPRPTKVFLQHILPGGGGSLPFGNSFIKNPTFIKGIQGDS